MYKARYYPDAGEKAQSRELPDWLFDGVVNEGVLHQVVKAYQANLRQGTGSAKNRSATRGGSRKPWRQKGTGRARQGTIRAAQWEGGGRAFPPIPGSWRQEIPKKLKAAAHRSALNTRAEKDAVVLVDFPEFDAPKTATLRDFVDELGVEGKVLLLTDGLNENLYLSARNVQRYEVRPFGEESAYDVLLADVLVIERSALERATSEAEESGLVERARRRRERRAARDEAARAEAEEAAAQRKDAQAARKARDEKRAARRKDRPAAKKAAAAAAKAEKKAEKAEPKAEKAEPKAAKPEPEAEKAPKGEKKAAKAEKKAAKKEAPSVDEIELPTVANLADFLQDHDDPAVVRALQERDERKTAQTHYDARLAELEGNDD